MTSMTDICVRCGRTGGACACIGTCGGSGPFRTPLVKTMKLWDLDCELLRDVARPHRKRKLPSPMASLVYDHHYGMLSDAHLIRWVQVDPVYASLSDDHYVLTERGHDVLRRLKTEYPPIEVSDV